MKDEIIIRPYRMLYLSCLLLIAAYAFGLAGAALVIFSSLDLK